MKINPSLINQKDTKHRKVCKQKAKKFLKKLFLVQLLEKSFHPKINTNMLIWDIFVPNRHEYVGSVPLFLL